MPENRGGRRQGAPGKSYANRTDLSVARAPQTGLQTAAAAGQVAPAPVAPAGPPQAPAITPDHTPNLMDPGTPGMPIQSGLPTGPGAGPATPPQGHDIAIIQKYLPELLSASQMKDAPPSFVALVQYLKGA